MATGFEDKLAGFIKKNNLFVSADRILLAVSGGADSTALLYTLCSLREKSVIKAELFCAHINHLLRGAVSDGDEQFAVRQADILKLPIATEKIDVRSFAKQNKLSIETAARQLRIEALIEIARKNKCSLVATAHQADDNAETVIHNIIRGTGLRGLAGIWPKKIFDGGIDFVRPMLCVTRAQITDYLEQRNLKWRTDRTNEDLTFRRNFIRHLLLPQLQRNSDISLAEQLSGLCQSARRLYNSVCNIAERLWPEAIEVNRNNLRIDLKIFSAQHPEVQIELVRRSLSGLGSGQKDLNRLHYEKILQLARKKVSNKKIGLPGGFTVHREYDKLILKRPAKAESRKIPDEIFALNIPGIQKFGSFVIESKFLAASQKIIENIKSNKDNFTEHFDFDKLQLPLWIRRRRTGDKFQPLGMLSRKKIGKFLTDLKVPQNVREKMLVVTDSEKIIWLWPIRIAEPAKITNSTKKILQLKITDSQNSYNYLKC
jgi:tRNA(Ile)-lysidine synthase